jgi:hypothetical protein
MDGTPQDDSSSGMEGVFDNCARGGKDRVSCTQPPFFVTRADGSDEPELIYGDMPIWRGEIAYTTYGLTPATPESPSVRVLLRPAVSGITDVKHNANDLTDNLLNAGGVELDVPVGLTRGLTVVLKVNNEMHRAYFVATRKPDEQHHRF